MDVWKENNRKIQTGRKQSEEEKLKKSKKLRYWYSNEDNKKEFLKGHKERAKKRRKAKVSVNELKKLYIDEELSIRQIANKFNVHYNSIFERLKKSDINIRTEQEGRELAFGRLMKSMNIKPNKPEKKVINIIKENNLPIHYVGDGKLIIEGLCPDFVCNPSKKIIEIYGDYWHKLPKAIERDKIRLRIYKKYGFDTLIIWESELKDINSVTTKIKKFMKC